MSLDVRLYSKTPISKKGTGVYVRENGMNKELTVEEVREKFPNTVVEENDYETTCVYSANITHNLAKMAKAAGIYDICWQPQEIGVEQAADIVPILEKGLADMKKRPEFYETFDSPNGWGLYKHFVPWLEKYLAACQENPDAIIEVSV